MKGVHTQRNIFHFMDSTVDIVDTWQAMEKLVDLCLTRSIGVSNFNSEQLTRILKGCRIKPVQNQVKIKI